MNRLLLVATMLLTACAEPAPPPTRAETEIITTRTYSGIPAAKVLAAAEQVIRLSATPRNLKIHYGPSAFRAQRKYFIYMVISAVQGSYTFDVATENVGSKVKLRASIANLSSAIMPGAFPNTLNTYIDGDLVTYPGPYSLLFARVDYLLGLRPDWVSCDKAKAVLPEKFGFEALCISAADALPSGTEPPAP